MHSLHSPWTSQAEGCSARKSLLLASRLKFQQVCQPSDPPVCAGKSKFLSSCQHMQMKTSDANTQHWLRQAQPLHQQTERSGAIQRLCAQPQISRYGPVSDDEWGESLPPPRDSKRVNTPDRKSMQAIAMPKKKQGPGDKLQTVQLQGGGKAQVPAPQEPTHTGIGDYARRVKQAGVRPGERVVRYEDTDEGSVIHEQQLARQQQLKERRQEQTRREGISFQHLEEEEVDEDSGTVQASEDALVASFVPGFDWDEFEAVADELKDTLRPAVLMEDEEAKTAVKELYTKSKAIELAKSGLILADLRATLAGSLYGETVWRFSQTPRLSVKTAQSAASAEPAVAHGMRSAQANRTRGRRTGSIQRGNGGSPAGKEGRAAPAADLNPELPYNKFKAGEGVLISHQVGQEATVSFAGTLLDVKKTYVTVVLDAKKSLQLSSFIKDYGKMPKFRLDKQAPEATTQRQLKALEKLTHLFCIKESKMFGLRKRTLEDLKHQFVAELSVKKILLGLGSSQSLQQYALQQPVWATGGSSQAEGERWRQEAGKLVRSIPNLNRSQKEAVAKAIFRRFTLWQGPPGTGKTRTLLAFMEVVVRTPSLKCPFAPILACADTNAAVDNIVEGLVERRVNVVRLGQPAKVRADLRHVCLEALCEKTPEGKEAVALRKQADHLLERYQQGGELYEEATPADIEYGQEKAKELRFQALKLIRRANTDVLQDCQVVAATCAGAGDETRLNKQLFRLVVIDEATQATEPSTLIPLMRGAESVVMAGDPCQLPPTVISRGAEEAGLQVTLFDRLQRSGIEPLLLDTQYRMHPLIAHMPSVLFYAGRLQSGVTAEDRPLPVGFPWPNPTCPVALVPCDFGLEKSGQASRTSVLENVGAVAGDVAEGGASYRNEVEADLAIRALAMLLRGGDVQSIAILTPYNGQVRELQRCFHRNKELARYEGMVDISSVDGYQGREADVIVMSTVRCNREGQLGFVTDPRRLNVAISRPRRGLVIIGSPRTLWDNDNWYQWLEWVKENKAVLHSDVVKQG